MTAKLKGWPRTMWQDLLAVARRFASRRRSAGAAHQDSAAWVRGWMVPLLLGGVAAYAIAEEITLTTYYPSPRGVYQELRTAGNVQVGLLDAPAVGNPVPRLHVVQSGAAPALRVDDEAPVGTILDPTPFLIDADGNVGVGTPSPGSALHLHRAVQPRLQLTNNASTTGGFVSLESGTLVNPQPDVSLANLEAGGSISLYAQTAGGVIKFIAGGFNLERMRIDAAGNVGIGTAPSPAGARLHVGDGTIRITGVGAPPTDGALCLNASGNISKCTNVVDSSGNCPCP